VTATSVVQTTATASDNFVRSALYIADVPTGATGDIIVAMSGTCNNMGISVWAADGPGERHGQRERQRRHRPVVQVAVLEQSSVVHQQFRPLHCGLGPA
jgi:hypothetical protein